MITTILSFVLGNKFFIGLVAIFLAVGGAWLKGRSIGKRNERARQATKTLRNVRKRRAVEDEIESLEDTEVKERLKKWARRG